MEEIAITLLTAAGLGWLAHSLRVPPLVGFLAAGFLLGGLGIDGFPGLDSLADIGVTLLLFTIGLKFDIRSLARPEAFGTATLHIILSVLVGAGLLGLLAAVGLSQYADLRSLVLVGFALSFSSTVLCMKVLEERSDDGSFYGQTAIAILVLQDIAAVVFITLTSDDPPSPWALALVLLIPAGWVLRRLLDHAGHGELLVLYGVAMALGPGYFLFDAVGIKGDLGALVMGLLFAGHARAIELSKSLYSVKELFLVGFFLSIGMLDQPTWSDLGLAALLTAVLLPLRALGFILLGRSFGMRNRSAVRTGLVLGNFSEFSIIVVSVGVGAAMLAEDWLPVVGIAVALSMVVSSLLNGRGSHLAPDLAARLPAQDPDRIRPDDRPIDTSNADVLILGMGKIGRSTYERITASSDLRVLAVDNDHAVVRRLREAGLNVMEGDATDLEFWYRICQGGLVQTVVLAMPFHDSNLFALDQLREAGFEGRITAVAHHPDQAEHLQRLGVDGVYNLYEGAGIAMADLLLSPGPR
ncbi:cation:proton antiporter [Zhihengliuella sp.]|uniref:cation:proton antiporter domain-containing protein n=1 Tax=Zhihengliuella sp. TaxID=1954483 RepID=UPI002811CEC9|nr:cation:proton antiporter [Zhihengliuella sp.]